MVVLAAAAAVLNQVPNRSPCWRRWASLLSRLGKLFVRLYVGARSRSPLSPLTDQPHTRRKTRNLQDGDPERAVEWLFSHPDDTGEEDKRGAGAGAAPAAPTLPGSPALPARYRLRAFISHKGPSVHSGHYVAHIRTGDSWVLFNDEKVVRADADSVRALKPLAYLYVFERERA